jgi:large subunit ribosomal protein L18
MIKRPDRKVNRSKRHRRVRVHVAGTSQRPRLAVFRSLNHVYAQLIDDGASRTLAAASTIDMKATGRAQGASQGKRNGVAQAQEVGKAIAAKAKAAGVSQVVFDRGGFLYHGRIKALADAAREAGLEF